MREFTNIVFLKKEDGVMTELDYIVVIEVTDTGVGINEAATRGDNADADYSISKDNRVVFPSNKRILSFDFTLLPDKVSEGGESFRVTVEPAEGQVPFERADNIQLHQSTYIIIMDNVRKSEAVSLSMV